jgi:anti-sigma regulatory factor (Ser/Thr protein kinase)
MGSVITAVPAAALWPLHTRLEVAATASAPGVARAHARAVARRSGLGPIAPTAELLTSELVTNAVLASARLADGAIPAFIRIWITSDGTALLVHVWDASTETPVPRTLTPDQERGRGLLLVDSLADEWGYYLTIGGKIVWALIR